MSSPGRPNPRPVASLAEAAQSERVAGRYRLERRLGEGGTASVYAAVDVFDGRRVALKRLLPDAPVRARALFEREYQVLVSLRHPSIVEAYEYGHHGDDVYYTMELITGTDLRKRAPIPWRETCAHVRDIASILGLLHARGLLHRDLSARNLLCTQTGRLKLIDFGAVTAFGPSSEVVGTPPFVAPEALEGGELDQRYDLFSLGALAYWLITGAHAYPARSLRDLPTLWRQAPAPVSARLASMGHAVPSPVPAELDELLDALLRTDRNERPGSTIELIDRLNAIAALAPEAEGEAARGYLDSKAFVGREREKRRVDEAIAAARDGHGQALLIEGSAGMGRTRFLAEGATLARIRGALAITVGPTPRAEPYAAALTVGRLMLASTPATATVDGLLPGSRSSAHPAGEFQAVMDALERLLAGLARERPVVLVLDDFHLRDEESQAVFVNLAHAVSEQPVVLLAASESGGRGQPSAALLTLRAMAKRLHLAPLGANETGELLRSIFGTTPYLERLASRLHRASEGHPAHCLELARHLVQSGAIRYAEGAWELPPELQADDLPASRGEGHRAAIERLSPEARRLAQRMSIPDHGDYPAAACAQVATRLGIDGERALSELERANVVQSTPEGFSFAHREVRAALFESLSEQEAALAHRDLAAVLLAEQASTPEGYLRAALHCLRAGDNRRAYPLIKRAALVMIHADEIDASQLHTTAPLFVEIDALLRDRGEDDVVRVEPLAALALAGYFDDKRYAVRYGDEAVATLARVLHLPLSRRLSGLVGRGPGLAIALAVAGTRLFFQRRRGPGLITAIRRLMQVCSALSGTAACCIDPLRIEQLARTVEPFTVLGQRHAASVTHRFIEALRHTVEDRPALANRSLRSLISLLESDDPITELEPSIRQQLLAGCLFALGVNESWRDGDEVLRIAARLDGFGPLYALSADQLRANYHAHWGDLAAFERYRQRVELHAIHLGTSWQVETWTAENSIPRALRLFDVMLLKRARQELARLSQTIPSLERAARHSLGSYFVMRERYAEGIPLLDDDEPPAQFVGWSGYRGTLARALNGEGEHARAAEVCHATLAHTTPDDLDYVTLTLVIHIELAVAEAGMGSGVPAHARLDELMARFAPFGNRLTLITLCEGRLRACLALRDFARARTALAELSGHCRALDIPSLIQLATKLERELDRAQYPKRSVTGVVVRAPFADPIADPMADPMADDGGVTRATGFSASVGTDVAATERATRALQLALERAGADEGFVVLPRRAGGDVIHLGGEGPRQMLVAWAKGQMAKWADPRTASMGTDGLDSQASADFHVDGRFQYCIHALAPAPREDDGVAVLVLGFEGRLPEPLDAETLEHVARVLSG